MHNNTLPKQSNILKVISAPKPKGANTAGTNKPSSLFSLRPALVLTLSPRQSGPTRTGSRRTGQTCQLPFRKNEIALSSPDFTFRLEIVYSRSSEANIPSIRPIRQAQSDGEERNDESYNTDFSSGFCDTPVTSIDQHLRTLSFSPLLCSLVLSAVVMRSLNDLGNCKFDEGVSLVATNNEWARG